MKDTYIVNYIKKMTQLMELRFPNMKREDLIEIIKNEAKKGLANKNNDIKINYERNGIVINSSKRPEMDLKTLDSYIAKNNPIISGYGVLFKRQDQFNNILGNMIRTLKKKRKEYKKEMFNHINDEDQSIAQMYDSRQKTTKVLNNSFYGATNESNSIFYHPHFGASITYSGEDLVTTAAVAFENFLGNNIIFENVSDIFIYINNIINEEYSETVEFNRFITKEELLTYLKSKLINDFDNFHYIEEFFDSMEENYDYDDLKVIYNSIYYKNNFYEFLDDSDIVDNYFDKIIGRYDFKNPNDPPKDMIDTLDKIWNILKDYVFYNYQDFYRFKRISSEKREVILTIDTDSNFLYLYPYFEYFNALYPDRVDSNNKESIVSIINIIMYQMTKLIDVVMMTTTKDWNIPEDFGKIINMKNEFLIERIMLTPNKKNYSSLVLMQEGNIINNPKIDVKGMAIRKVNTNKNVRTYFTKLLDEEVLNTNEINLARIIDKFKLLENNIRESLLEGNLEYSLPVRANEASSYKFPERIMAFRGVVNWNILFPEEEINLPEKVNMIKLNIDSYDVIQDNIKDRDIREKFKKVFKNQNGIYTSNGLDVICIPKKIKKIPDILKPFVAVEEMVNNNISPGIVILESLGFKTLDILTSQFTTNVINF